MGRNPPAQSPAHPPLSAGRVTNPHGEVAQETFLPHLHLFSRALRANQYDARHAFTVQALNIPARADSLFRLRRQPLVAIPAATFARRTDRAQRFSNVHAILLNGDRPPDTS